MYFATGEKRRDYYAKEIQKAGNCQKSLFKMANTLLDRNEEKVLPSHTDSEKLANDFNDFYIEKVAKIRKSIPVETPDESFKCNFDGDCLEDFEPTDIDEVTQILKVFGFRTSQEDPIPSFICQQSMEILVPVLVDLINHSLLEGSVEGVKNSVIDPLIKKITLDPDTFKNYRPVNKLMFVSKITERVVQKRLDSHMILNSLHEPSQYGYKKHHSTESMLLSLTNEVIEGFDNNLATVVIVIDLSAAFDTLDPETVLYILEHEIGIKGTALKWFRSFLTGRTQKVKINGKYSQGREISFGVPQGSVLGPCLFGINVRSQPMVFRKCNFTTSSFADDANGRRKFALSFQTHVLQNGINSCMQGIVKWSNLHFVKVNADKTEIILLRPPSLNKQVIIKGVFIGDECIRFAREVKNVGVWLDENLTLSKQVSTSVSHGFKVLKDIKKVKKFFEKSHLEKLTHAMVTSRLDYCNSILYGTSSDNMDKMQRLQNFAAKCVLSRKRGESATAALKELHWLNVKSRIVYKVLLIMWKAVNKIGPVVLKISYKETNSRSSENQELETYNCKTAIGHRLIAFHGTRLWNALPLNIRMEKKDVKFKKSLKTFLFNSYDMLVKNAFKYTQ